MSACSCSCARCSSTRTTRGASSRVMVVVVVERRRGGPPRTRPSMLFSPRIRIIRTVHARTHVARCSSRSCSASRTRARATGSSRGSRPIARCRMRRAVCPSARCCTRMRTRMLTRARASRVVPRIVGALAPVLVRASRALVAAARAGVMSRVCPDARARAGGVRTCTATAATAATEGSVVSGPGAWVRERRVSFRDPSEARGALLGRQLAAP